MKAHSTSLNRVREVHVIFKTHLDLGFTDFAAKVQAGYFRYFFPRAIALARALRERGGPERFVWTVGSWLIYQYLEKESATDKPLLERAIRDGDIVWHGLPFTTHSELMDASLFRHGLSLSKKLDRRFGRRTIAAKMTDVPGHTRAIVPLLARAGVRFLHIGTNPASTAPDVPPVFIWRHEGHELVVMYHTSYGDLMTPPGLDVGICFAHAGDNHGPQTREQVLGVFETLRGRFPEARIIGSTLNAFAARLLTIRSSLPVIEQEIGDTWIHGVGSDPGKVRTFRAFCRLRNRWLGADRAHSRGGRKLIDDFSDELLCIPEHTWGMDEKTHLADYSLYTRAELRRLRGRKSTKRFEASWAEQRQYLVRAAEAVKASPLAREVNAVLDERKPAAPDTDGFSRVSDLARVFATRHFDLRFDAATGAIAGFKARKTGRTWADARHPLGLFIYEIFSAADYRRFAAQYLRDLEQHRAWAIPDFTKPGMEKLKYAHQRWNPALKKLLYRAGDGRHDFILNLEMPAPPVEQFGCPKALTLEVSVSDLAPAVTLKLQTFKKNACRLPEAMWFSFCPVVLAEGTWTLDKMGEAIDPRRVVRNGNRKLHAVTQGVRYADAKSSFVVDTLDAALVAPGEPSLLDFNNRLPNLRRGMHFNLYNNVWGTNFPMWYADDMLFRFVMHV